MNKINSTQFVTGYETQLQETKQHSQETNKLLFNFNSGDIKDGYSAMGLELSSSNTNKTQIRRTNNADGTTIVSYDYDEDGLIDCEVIRDKNGEQKELIEYTYGTCTYEDGTTLPIKIAEHEYWENGKRTASATSKTINGKEVEREEFTYTANGTSNSYTRYENGKLVTKTETSFYKDDEILKDFKDIEKETKIYDENNQLETIIEYTYPKDENGKVIANIEKVTDVKTGKVTINRYE